MHAAAKAYSQTATQTLGPRELEAHLLIKAASKLQVIRDDFDARRGDLAAALLYNRKLWTVFVSAVTDSAHQMPVQLRENIANVGVFVFLRTAELQEQPDANALTALIDINRNIAAGLRGTA